MEVSKIWEELSKTVDDIHASNLKGRDRNKYMMEKAVRLGAEPPRKQHDPLNIRVGKASKARERTKKVLLRAREEDLVIANNIKNAAMKKKKKNSAFVAPTFRK